MRTLILWATIWIVSPIPALAQSASAGSLELPELLPRDREIHLARSAAPREVSEHATILTLERGGYVTAVEGTNGATCYVSRTWPGSLEPHCFDAEGSRTILPIHLRRAELREEGLSKAEIEADVSAGLLSGSLRLPSRPAVSYMMSAEQILYDDSGEYVGRWKPHLMIYYPNMTSSDIGWIGAPTLEAAVVVDEGTVESNLMIVVPEFAAIE